MYISIDIETTGTNPDVHNIIEFAAVTWDKKHSFHRYVTRDKMIIDPFCAHLHHDLWPLVSQQGIYESTLATSFRHWLKEVNGDYKYTAAGKNFSTFDIRFLRRIKTFPLPKARVIDVGSVWWPGPGTPVPDTETCAKLAGIPMPKGFHTALVDATLVVDLINAKFKN